MNTRPYCVDWEYLRGELLRFKGDDSYSDLIDCVPGLGKTTAYRFLNGQRDLDLSNLLKVVNALNLHIEDVIVECAYPSDHTP